MSGVRGVDEQPIKFDTDGYKKFMSMSTVSKISDYPDRLACKRVYSCRTLKGKLDLGVERTPNNDVYRTLRMKLCMEL